MYSDVSIDIETLGTDPGSVVVSIGAVVFDRAVDGLGPTFHATMLGEDQLDGGLGVSIDTIKWWADQDRVVRDQVFKKLPYAGVLTQDGRPVAMSHEPVYDQTPETLRAFGAYIQTYASGAKIWAKPPTFDVTLIEVLFRNCKLGLPWTFRQAADLRTLLLAHPVEPAEPILAHVALYDAVAQAQTVQRAWAARTRAVEALTAR